MNRTSLVPRVVAIAAAGYVAQISAQGAALRSLRHDGRELVHHDHGSVAAPQFSGAVLAPWPNRVAGGRYRFGDRLHQLPINEVGRGNALHGLALWEQWHPADVDDDRVSFDHIVLPRPGYPFTVAVRATYRLDGCGLHLTIDATNAGATRAPVGLSAHPYLMADQHGPLDDWTMRMPCAKVLLTDDRLLPRGCADVGNVGLDYRIPRRVGNTEIDHAFTAVDFDVDGRTAADLVGPSGAGVRIEWDTACRWLQVYTLQSPGTPNHRRSIAIEPMSCAPDAFNSGSGLVSLAPSESTAVTMTISAITGSAGN